MFVLAHVDAEIEAGEATPEAVLAVHRDTLERAVQPQPAAALNAAPACDAITSRSTPLRCASVAKRVQTASRNAIAGMSTSRQMRERSRISTARAICKRLAGGDDQDALETDSRFGQARRIERSVIKDRDQAAARCCGDEPAARLQRPVVPSSVATAPEGRPPSSSRSSSGMARWKRSLDSEGRGSSGALQLGLEGLEGRPAIVLIFGRRQRRHGRFILIEHMFDVKAALRSQTGLHGRGRNGLLKPVAAVRRVEVSAAGRSGRSGSG